MKLIPVIELMPGAYSQSERNIPEHEDVNGWSIYWKECLEESGITDLEPVVRGSWFVELNEINEHNLRIILSKELEDYDESCNIEEDISALCGGYILFISKSIRILPSCCGDLSNIGEWEEAVEYFGDEKKELWIGHPWLLVKGNKSRLEITQTAEYGEPSKPEHVTVQRDELRKEVQKTKIILKEIHNKLLPIVAEYQSEKAQKITQQLIYGHQKT
jgi:hypothetical protein